MAVEFEAEVPMTLDDALADLSARFLMNLPLDELPSVDRLFMQIQQAHWFYEDFYVDEYEHVPHLKAREFTKLLFERCPLLEAYKSQHGEFYQRFKEYIVRIPVYGTILFTPKCKGVILCQSWSGKCWNAPRGKLNAGESPVQCAARETEEETGFNPAELIDEEVYVEWMNGDQLVRLYVVVGAPDSFSYAPTTRKEVGAVKRWATKTFLAKAGGKKRAAHKRFWPLYAAMGWLRAFVSQGGRMPTSSSRTVVGSGGGRPARAPAGSGAAERVADSHNAATFGGEEDEGAGWSVDDMFATNAALTGVTSTYDGSAADFGGPTVVYHKDAVAASMARGGGGHAQAMPMQGLQPAGPQQLAPVSTPSPVQGGGRPSPAAALLSALKAAPAGGTPPALLAALQSKTPQGTPGTGSSGSQLLGVLQQGMTSRMGSQTG